MVAPFASAGRGAIAKGHADHDKADGVVGGVTKEIEGVRLQGCRTGCQARAEPALAGAPR